MKRANRTLSPFQKKILQAFADDVEGRPSTVSFGSPPPPPEEPQSTPSSPPPPPPPPAEDTSNGTAYPSSSPSMTSSPSTHRSAASNSPPATENAGLAGTVASALGGTIGWVERLLGRGTGGDNGKGKGR